MVTLNRRPPPFRLLPRITRCEQLQMSYLRWGRSLWFKYDSPPPRAGAPRTPWPVAAFRILALSAAAWIVAVPLVVAAVGDLPARLLP